MATYGNGQSPKEEQKASSSKSLLPEDWGHGYYSGETLKLVRGWAELELCKPPPEQVIRVAVLQLSKSMQSKVAADQLSTPMWVMFRNGTTVVLWHHVYNSQQIKHMIQKQGVDKARETFVRQAETIVRTLYCKSNSELQTNSIRMASHFPKHTVWLSLMVLPSAKSRPPVLIPHIWVPSSASSTSTPVSQTDLAYSAKCSFELDADEVMFNIAEVTATSLDSS